MIESVLEFLKNNDVEFKEKVALSSLSAIRIGGIAEAVAFPGNIKQLIDLLLFLDGLDVRYNVVGCASNLLFRSEVYDGVIVKTDRIREDLVPDKRIKLYCGTPFPYAVSRLANAGFGGAEALAHIPGTVGGMVYNNAGAYGLEVSDILLYSDVYDHEEKRIIRLQSADMQFAYRDSVLKHRKYTLLSATFNFVPRSTSEIKEEINRYRQMRASSQPLGLPSLGSIFKRAGDIGAGMLIDRVGLKGYRIGGAAISEKHAGFIVNLGGASAEDVLMLVELAKQRVYDEFGVKLITEIEVI